ncbi:hypothetical protein INT47_000162 [Mucor saturninus]|uniref:Uncharacterized protein n=1 Tax=Mucor saturninus TaxID=64648 RepID=A0A8H7RIQ6_9FUNG|nr:hypothetical protein INT47_000162 [Mucor saturninus]
MAATTRSTSKQTRGNRKAATLKPTPVPKAKSVTKPKPATKAKPAPKSKPATKPKPITKEKPAPKAKPAANVKPAASSKSTITRPAPVTRSLPESSSATRTSLKLASKRKPFPCALAPATPFNPIIMPQEPVKPDFQILATHESDLRRLKEELHLSIRQQVGRVSPQSTDVMKRNLAAYCQELRESYDYLRNRDKVLFNTLKTGLATYTRPQAAGLSTQAPVQASIAESAQVPAQEPAQAPIEVPTQTPTEEPAKAPIGENNQAPI